MVLWAKSETQILCLVKRLHRILHIYLKNIIFKVYNANNAHGMQQMDYIHDEFRLEMFQLLSMRFLLRSPNSNSSYVSQMLFDFINRKTKWCEIVENGFESW